MKMLDNAYHKAVSASAFLSEIQMSLVLYDMEYPMRDNNWTTSVIMEYSQIQTILCPIHFLLKYCAEEAMGYFPMEYCVPTKFCDMMGNRAPKSVRSCFGDLPFLMDVDPTYDSFVADTKVATADAFWYLSGVLWYIDKTKKELSSETIAWLVPMVVMIDDIMSEVKKRIEDFDEDALLNFWNTVGMKTFRFVYTNDIGETCRQTCELEELFVILMMMSYRSTRPNGKTAYKQVELMDVGQTITPMIMRGDEVLWQLEITRLS